MLRLIQTFNYAKFDTVYANNHAGWLALLIP
jgi:hypothetical protein